MTYKEALTLSMTALSGDPRNLFVGYGLRHGRAAGTMKEAPEDQILETTVAENLMMGAAIGLSLTGRLPVVFVERADFLLNALDALVNHLNAMSTISQGEFNPAVIVRVVIGNSTKPLFTGATHTQDFSDAVSRMVDFRVVRLETPEQVVEEFARARRFQVQGYSTILFERKDLW